MGRSQSIRALHGGATALLILLVVLVSGCAGGGDGETTRIYATIVAENGRYILLADTTGHRYVPDRIPMSYREAGLKVMAVGYVAEGRTTEHGDSLFSIELTSLVARADE